MKSRTLAALVLTAVAAGAGAQQVKPFLSPVFTDNMVLQRGMKTPVWGWAAPGDEVTVSVQGKTGRARAGADGKWLARVGPLAPGGPVEVSIAGPQTVTLHNVLIGDVWLCSGQSNMEMGIKAAMNADQEVASATDGQIRLFTIPHTVGMEPMDVPAGGPWLVCSPENIQQGTWAGFSAAAYYFGRDLRKDLNIPIGLLHTSWGGTPAESWTSGPALYKQFPEFRSGLDDLAEWNAEGSKSALPYEQRLANWLTANDAGTKGNWSDPTTDVSDWKSMVLPGAWENSGLPDLDGAMWYRRTVTVPEAAAGAAATLRLGNIDDWDTAWVNGTKVGETLVFPADRAYPVPAGVLKAGENTIVVRVLDGQGLGGMVAEPAQMHLDIAGQAPIPLAGPWRYKIGADLRKTPALPRRMEDSPYILSSLYNGMIAPVVPFGIKGAIWYQGEANAPKAYQYRTLLPAMIRDWRDRWGEGAFPFMIVQLANFMPNNPNPVESDWAELRDAQLLTAETLPKTGLAVAIDIGDGGDIHPKNKQEVGRRLALAARHIAYGEKIAWSGPIYRKMKVEGGKVRLSFTNTDEGLTAKGGPLTGFQIAGADRKWVWGDAVIDGNTVVVSSPGVPAPVAVRYAWQANPTCNLYNGAGLPASPFRTDNWPLTTQPAK